MRLLAARASILTIATLSDAGAATGGDSAGPIGLGLTHDGSAVVQISTCGPGLRGIRAT